MSTNTIPTASAARGLATGKWRLDPARSMTVKGRFDRYQDDHQ